MKKKVGINTQAHWHGRRVALLWRAFLFGYADAYKNRYLKSSSEQSSHSNSQHLSYLIFILLRERTNEKFLRQKKITMTTIFTKLGKVVNSITTARMSKALCIFSAGILLSISIHENSKDFLHFSGSTEADLSFLVELVKLNQNLAIGLVSGFLIGASHI